MAMTAEGFSDAIKSELTSKFDFPGFNDTDLQALCDALGNACYSYITANAEVIVAVASVSGVTPGGGVSGSGTGTGTIT